MTSGAYQNATCVVGVAKVGFEDGHPLMAGSVIVDPNGFVVVRAQTEGKDLLVHDCDMDLCIFGKTTIFDFARH
jgi:predicted amidohydrolase